MHELSVCQSLISQVTEIAARENANCVHQIRLRIGPLSGIEAALLIQAFPIAAAGSVAEGAELVINTLPVRVSCTQCGAESDVEPNRLLCSACGDYRTRLISGDEMLLASLELERRTDAD